MLVLECMEVWPQPTSAIFLSALHYSTLQICCTTKMAVVPMYCTTMLPGSHAHALQWHVQPIQTLGRQVYQTLIEALACREAICPMPYPTTGAATWAGTARATRLPWMWAGACASCTAAECASSPPHLSSTTPCSALYVLQCSDTAEIPPRRADFSDWDTSISAAGRITCSLCNHFD